MASESGGQGRHICPSTWTCRSRDEQSTAAEGSGHVGEVEVEETKNGEGPGQRKTNRHHGRLGRRSGIAAASCRVKVVAVWTHDAIQKAFCVDRKAEEMIRQT